MQIPALSRGMDVHFESFGQASVRGTDQHDLLSSLTTSPAKLAADTTTRAPPCYQYPFSPLLPSTLLCYHPDQKKHIEYTHLLAGSPNPNPGHESARTSSFPGLECDRSPLPSHVIFRE